MHGFHWTVVTVTRKSNGLFYSNISTYYVQVD